MSARTLRITLIVPRGASAWRVAGYLTYIHYAGIEAAVLGQGESCSKVQKSRTPSSRACPSP